MSSSSERSASPERKDSKPNKIFVTNLEASVDLRKLEEELKELFGQYGQVTSCVVKKSFNSEYSYAFIDFKEGDDATLAMEKLNGQNLGEKKMKVELQDHQKRRKTNSEGCYKCGKPGHFARECRSSRVEDDRRGRSRQHSKDKKKKKSHRHRSESSESRHHKKKQKKKHKSHKKHSKKSKKKYSSESDSSE